MFKRIAAAVCCLALLLVVFPRFGGAEAAGGDVSIDFSDANMAALEAGGSVLATGENAEGGVVKGEFSHSGDESFKVTHIPDTNYSSVPNGVRLDFGTPLPADTIYTISMWFYVPEEGNTEGKNNLLGGGVLINGRGDVNSYKSPATPAEAGSVTYDEWMNRTYETPAFEEEITYMVFRFYTNDAVSHPDVWYLDDISITSAAPEESFEVQDLPGLRDIYKDYFLVGAAAGAPDLMGKRLDLINRHFDAVTYANEMKPENAQREEGVFTFDNLDGMTRILRENDQEIVGHTLFWHEQTPAWMWEEPDKARERLEKHIEEVLGHAIDVAGDALIAVDVVNEAMRDGVTGGDWRDAMRLSGWFDALGPDLVEIAFRKADEVRVAKGRPDLKLYYNDFNLDYRDKAGQVYNMVTELRASGVPIDGIGMQGHYNQDTKPENVLETLKLFSGIPGIEVSVTEMDITIQSALGSENLNEDEDELQANLYAELFKVFKKFAAGPANPAENMRLITRVTFWGLTDDRSWRGDRFPLLFDKNFQAKGAFYGAAFPEDYESYLSGEKPPETPAVPGGEDPVDPTPAPEATPTPSPTPPSPTPEPSGESGGNLRFILLAAAGVVVIAVVVVVILKRKR